MVGKKFTRYKIKTISSNVTSKTKLGPYAAGHALGMVSVVAILFYTVMVWFSDYNASVIIQQYPLRFSFYDWTLIIGFLQTYVLSYVAGWIFAKIYNETIRG